MIKLAVVLISFLIFSSCSFCEQLTKEVCFEKVCVQAEVADTESKRQLGLMFREGMPENKGMLFVFAEEGRHSFWMKNMKFPLDIIWIGEALRVAQIKTNVQPCKDSCESIAVQAKAKYVLEVNAGFAEKNRIKIGDTIEVKSSPLKE